MVIYKSLRTRIVIYFIFLALLVTAGITSLAIVQARNILREELSQNLTLIGNEVYHVVNNMVARAILDVQMLTGNTVLCSNDISFETKQAELLRFKKTLRNYEDLTILDTNGTILVSTDYNLRGSPMHKSYFLEALKGRCAISRVHAVPDPFKLVINFAGPLYDTQKKLIGVLSVQLNMNTIWNMIKHIHIGRTGYVFIIDSDNTIIASPDKGNLLLQISAELDAQINQLLTLLRYRDTAATHMIGAFFDIGKLTQQEKELTTAHIDWKIIVIQREEEAFSLLYTFILQVVILATIFFVLITLLGIRYSRSITMPIKRLAQTALKIGEGKFDQHVNIEEEDEIGQLAKSFNLMTGNLKASHEKLKKEISERKQVEEVHTRLITAIEQADETVVITDKPGKIIYTNPAFESQTGYTSEESAGQNINIVKSDKHEKSFYEQIWKTISKGQTWKGYYKNKKKDGTLYDNAATISPIKNPDGEITGFVNIGRDVTEEYKLQEQLRQSQKMESIGTLAGGIAHDFNNILAAVIGFAELSINDVGDRPRTHESLKQVLKAAYRAKELVGQILAFSRSKTLKRVQIKTTPIVNEVCKFIRSSLPTTIEIKQVINTMNDCIMSDPTQFQQILMNLCTNAGHAMMETGGVLEVLLEETALNEDDLLTYPELKSGSYLRLSVKDNGYGISKEYLERIFEPYFTTKDLGEGTGLGLAVVHGIINDYGGAIRVYSEAGKGTVFHVLFPLIKKNEVADNIEGSGPLPVGTEAIMLIDDEEPLVMVGTIILEELGYRVTGFTSPEVALDMFTNSKDSYDLIITDKTMPKMTGLVLSAGIKKVRPDIPILLCTGFQDKDIDDKVEIAGITDYVMKPLNRREIAIAVRKVLDKKTV